MASSLMRSVVARRSFCSAVPSALHQRATAILNQLIEKDWVDSDKSIDIVVESADAVIDEYRSVYNPDKPHDDLYRDMESLYIAKEAALMVEAYGDTAENIQRAQEDMLGLAGDNPTIPEGGLDNVMAMFEDYIQFVNSLEDKRIRGKVESEMGRKMVHMKMMLSKENFGVEVAPIAGDHVVPNRPKHVPLPDPNTDRIGTS